AVAPALRNAIVDIALRHHGVDEPDPATDDQDEKHREKNIGGAAVALVLFVLRGRRLRVHAHTITPPALRGKISRSCFRRSITSAFACARAVAFRLKCSGNLRMTGAGCSAREDMRCIGPKRALRSFAA